MKMKATLLAVSVLTLGGLGLFWNQSGNTAKAAVDPNATPVVVELFTSEGCSSCPSADAVLTRLALKQPVKGARIIALSEHVDYWNRLGWRDPYSAEQFSKRQSGYSEAFKTDSVYTPQMVVDGQTEFIGSNEAKATEAIIQATKQPKAKVGVTASGSGDTVTVAVDVKEVPGKGTADVYVALTEDNLNTIVPSGENAGRRLSHNSVVRHLELIGKVKAGGSFAKTVNLKLKKGNKRQETSAVVFVQESGFHRILGAGVVDL